ncbi:hypothetical protein Tco_0238565 [Tanacetum coccineum]
MGDTIAQTRSENVSKFSNDPLLVRGNTLRSGEDRLKLQELMELCTNLQNRVIDLEKTKTAQAQEITSLKLRVKKLEKKGGSRTHKLKRLYKVGRSARIVSSDEASLGDQEDASKQGRKIDDIDKDAEITLVDETQGRYGDDIMFDVSDLAGEEVFVAEQGVSDKDVNLSVDEVTLAQALAALKSAKVQEKANVVEEPNKAKGLVIHEEEQATTPTVSSQQPSQAKIQDKGKAKMIEPEPVKKLSKKDQLKLDEEVAQRLQAEFDEQERIEREKAEANIALKETWDDIQAKIEADCLLAERLQAREQEELTIEERAILFQQLLEKRRKHFAAKRAEEKRNRPPTKAQQRSIMCTYLKNIEGWKPKDLKSKSFANIQELFDKAMKRVNTFVDYRTELVEGSSEKAEAEIAQESSSKRAGDELEQESIKKQKVDEDKETVELKSLMEVIPDEEEVAVDAIPLATKPPSIVDWIIHKEGKKRYYQIIKADGSSKIYLVVTPRQGGNARRNVKITDNVHSSPPSGERSRQLVHTSDPLAALPISVSKNWIDSVILNGERVPGSNARQIGSLAVIGDSRNDRGDACSYSIDHYTLDLPQNSVTTLSVASFRGSDLSISPGTYHVIERDMCIALKIFARSKKFEMLCLVTVQSYSGVSLCGYMVIVSTRAITQCISDSLLSLNLVAMWESGCSYCVRNASALPSVVELVDSANPATNLLMHADSGVTRCGTSLASSWNRSV